MVEVAAMAVINNPAKTNPLKRVMVYLLMGMFLGVRGRKDRSDQNM
jgi:hypothetical protein